MVWGADRVGHPPFAQRRFAMAPTDSNPPATFGAAARVCEELGLAFVRTAASQARRAPSASTDVPKQSPLIREIYTGALILNSDYTCRRSPKRIVTTASAIAVSFGRPYISNPDLEKRIAAGAHWVMKLYPNKDVPKSW